MGFLCLPSVSSPRSLRPSYYTAQAQGEDAKWHCCVLEDYLIPAPCCPTDSDHDLGQFENRLPCRAHPAHVTTLSSAHSPAPPCWPAGKPFWLYFTLEALPKHLLIESDVCRVFPLVQRPAFQTFHTTGGIMLGPGFVSGPALN